MPDTYMGRDIDTMDETELRAALRQQVRAYSNLLEQNIRDHKFMRELAVARIGKAELDRRVRVSMGPFTPREHGHHG